MEPNHAIGMHAAGDPGSMTTSFQSQIAVSAFAGLMLCLVAPSLAVADEKFPQIWRKTMTNDPSTNYDLGKFSAPLKTPLAGAARNMVLARVLGRACEGAAINKTVLRAYIQKSGINA